jgi:hypothetical protein
MDVVKLGTEINKLFAQHSEFEQFCRGHTTNWLSLLYSSMISASNGQEISYLTASCKENQSNSTYEIRMFAAAGNVVIFTEFTVHVDDDQDTTEMVPVGVIPRSRLEKFSVANQQGIYHPFGFDNWPGDSSLRLSYPGHEFELPYSRSFSPLRHKQQARLLVELHADLQA